MGLKWEYELAFPGMIAPDSVPGALHRSMLLSKHWDADAFHEFVMADEKMFPGQLLFSGHEQTKHGIKLDTVSVLSEWIPDLSFDLVVKGIETAILYAIAGGAAVLVVTLPNWVPIDDMTHVLGDVARRQVWKPYSGSRLLNVRFVCDNQSLYDSVNNYFQGTWEF